MAAWSWAFWVGGGAIGVLGLWPLYRALFADRSRGRRRCPKCWYDMAGVPGLRCPEGGRTAKTEKRLLKTRRRWWRAAGACIVLALAASIAYTPEAVRLGWPGVIPTWVIALVARWYDTPDYRMFRILADRVANGPDNGESWVSREALANYGKYRLRHPIPVDSQVPWLKSASAYNLLETVRFCYGFHFLEAAGDRAWNSADEIRGQVNTREVPRHIFAPGKQLLSDCISYDAAHSLNLVCLYDGDRHSLMSRYILDDPNPYVRSEVLMSLSSDLLDPRVAISIARKSLTGNAYGPRTDVLEALLERKDLLKCRSELESLAPVCDPIALDLLIHRVPVRAAFPRLCEMVRVGDVQQRREHLRLLASWGADSTPCREVLITVLRSDSDEICRMYAASALGWVGCGQPFGQNELRQSISKDSSDNVRVAALEAYLKCQSFADSDQIGIQVLQDLEPSVRAGAARCLGRYGSNLETVRKAIARLSDDSESRVRSAAEDAIAEIDRRSHKGEGK